MTEQSTSANLASTDTPESSARGSRAGSRARKAVLGVAVVGLAFVGFGGSPAHAVAGTTGLHYRSAATCKPISSPVVAASDVISVNAPTMYAANVTTGADSQLVGFRQRLVKWNGSAWLNVKSSATWTSPATDSRAALDFTDGAGHVYRMPSFNFTAGAGYYGVVTDYFWYQSSRTSGGSDVAWAYHSNNNPTTYCTFPY